MAGFRWMFVTLSCSSLLALGCGAADDGSDDVGESDTTGATSTSASTTVATTASTTVSTTDATSTTTTASTTVSTTETTTDTDPSETDTDTGGGACEACDAGQYCDWSVNSCGTQPYDLGVCTDIPDGCPGVEQDPVCGCDGVVYSGECAAALLGVDVEVGGACESPGELFACGYKYCDPATSYCQWSVSDIGGYPDSFGCAPLPGACGDTPTCECLAGEPCADFGCEPTRDGGLLVTCPGG